ncbi:beta-ketoacyl synthase chain length factor [Sporocytophaga myxococcoides]|uniref:beta-ketoacyl synthase chain length factor n=1 Tax=Sporocytophaga myxococcoides TaxID=153721 RepID=UPI0003F50A65|nr:beta-ketoacyl synthase chain length factor [Sporocytophaga myxococcoides]
MQIYINGLGNVSPQNTLDNSSFLEEIKYHQDYFKVVEPNYKEFISPAAARRMGKVIKMGVAAANYCLRDAKVENPDAIITGTGMGCLEDTENFLCNILNNKEQFLTPTSFIQSTHNTVGAQIALLLTCNNYNFTYVHRDFSFESAFVDSLLLLKEGEASNVLLGGVDEITPNHYSIHAKKGLWKTGVQTSEIFNKNPDGTMPGEGATFFSLSSSPNDPYATVLAVEMLFNTNGKEDLKKVLDRILSSNNIQSKDIDLILLGANGDKEGDKVYSEFKENFFKENNSAAFKNLCGEYSTASAFGVWLASQILKKKEIPTCVSLTRNSDKEVNKILLYNHYCGNHSLILLSSC